MGTPCPRVPHSLMAWEPDANQRSAVAGRHDLYVANLKGRRYVSCRGLESVTYPNREMGGLHGVAAFMRGDTAPKPAVTFSNKSLPHDSTFAYPKSSKRRFS